MFERVPLKIEEPLKFEPDQEPENRSQPAPAKWLKVKDCLDWIDFAKYSQPASAPMVPDCVPRHHGRTLHRPPRDEKERGIAFEYIMNLSDKIYE